MRDLLLPRVVSGEVEDDGRDERICPTHGGCVLRLFSGVKIKFVIRRINENASY